MAALNSDQYGNTVPVPGNLGGITPLYGSIELSAAQSASDTVNLFTMPKGFTPLFGFVVGDDIDTGTETYDIDIGTSSDADYFGNLGVITGDAVTGIKPETAIWMPLGGLLLTQKPTEFTADTDVIATVNAAANAGGTGTLTIILCGLYRDPRVS